ncbi:rhomboid family intramembrane serine protease [Compostibacter hankyongensis]
MTRKFEARRRFSLGSNHNMVVRLILVNAIVFTAISFIKVIYLLTGQAEGHFMGEVLPWLVLPAEPAQLLRHPWTLLSYMFVHISIWQLLGTAIWLWWFGDILQGLAGHRRILPLYLFGGLAGAVFFLAAYAVFPGLQATRTIADTAGIGAGASVIAIVAAATTLAPRYKVFPMLRGGIPLYVVAIIYVVLDVVGYQGRAPLSYLPALAGGAFLGFLFIRLLQRGHDPGAGLNRLLYRAGHLLDPQDRPQLRARKGGRAFYKQHVPPYRKSVRPSSGKVDELLDKINQSGYDSLSQEEKDILLRASRQDNETV